MKEYLPQQIEQTRGIFGQAGFPVGNAMVGDLEVSYYVIPQDKNPNLPDFAFRMTSTDPTTREVSGIFGVSDSVPAELRPYWATHEIIEFTQIGINQPGRCALAEEIVVGLVPDELKGEYVDRRKAFFDNLVNFFRQDTANYTQDDIEEAEAALNYLQELHS